jgi:hypothetical protein
MNPLSPIANAEYSRALLANGQCNEALSRLGMLTAMKPPLLRAAPIAAQCHALQGRWPEAIAALRPQAKNDLLTRAFYGYVVGRGGNRDEAANIQAGLVERWRQRNTGAAYVAMVSAGTGMRDDTFLWLDRGIDDGSLVPTHGNAMILEPMFRELQSDPRFAQLKKRLRIPPR